MSRGKKLVELAINSAQINYTVVENVEIEVVDWFDKSSENLTSFNPNLLSESVSDQEYKLTTENHASNNLPFDQASEDVTVINFDLLRDKLLIQEAELITENLESDNLPFDELSEDVASINSNVLPKIGIDSIEDQISDDSDFQGLVPYNVHSDSDTSDDLPHKTKKRRKRVQVKKSTWFVEQNKKNREQGKKYCGRGKVIGKWVYEKPKQPRAMKDRCKCKETQTGAMKCTSVSEEERNKIFQQFWKMTWGEKKTSIDNLVTCAPVKRPRGRKDHKESRRAQSLIYHLKVNDNPTRVCRTLFLNTLGIGRWTILNWKNKVKTCGERSQRVVKPNTSKPFAKERKELEAFFDALPVMESHYCRASTNKKYLLPEWSSKKSLYDFYVKDWCISHNTRALSVAVFYQVFDLRNMGLFHPKKDQCQMCASFATGQVSEEKYHTHLQKKEEARLEKAKDKNSNSIVFTVDLEAILLAPKSNISSLYYKTKLQVHNLVFYNLMNRDGYCFIWNEVEGGVNAEDFASVWVHLLETKIINSITPNEGFPTIIFYTDGCSYQNRNSVLSNALLNVAINYRVIIEQKYLETGHTQMEADCIHSTVERALKNKNINVPAEYVSICRAARKKPRPYDVAYLNHDFFKKFDDVQFYKSIRPGRGKGDPKVTDVRAFRYTPDGEIFFKLRFNDSWLLLPQRKSMAVRPLQWNHLSNLYNTRLKIKAKKFEDLQLLKSTLAKDYHEYYDNLPHE